MNGEERAGAFRHLEELGRRLAFTDTEVEFYFLGGAVIYQAFAARPGTARVGAMFRPADTVRRAARDVAEREGLPEGWLARAVRSALGDGAGRGAYVDLLNVRAFAALPEYVLAVKCAAMRLGDDFHEADDVRYVLRAMNLATAGEALAVVGRYFTERQLAPGTRERLEALTGI